MDRNSAIAQAIDSSPLNRGMDGRAFVADRDNVTMIFNALDVVLFEPRGEGAFEVHFLFLSRGRAAIGAARASFDRLFQERADAALIYGLVPEFRRDVKLLARWAGGRSVGIRQTSEGACELFVLSREMWGMKK